MLHQNNEQPTTPRRLLHEALNELRQFCPEAEPACLKIAAADELLRRSEALMHADPLAVWPAVDALHRKRPRRVHGAKAA